MARASQIKRTANEVLDRSFDQDGQYIYTSLTNASGNSIGSIQSTGGDYHLSTNMIQEVNADTNNSSTVNLAASATFTGKGTSTLGVVGLQVSLKTDQNCTVYVDQSPDNSNWDLSDQYEYNALINNFGITVQAVNSYWRVRVTNLSTSTATSYFRLQGVLCPIVEAVPRSLDEHGKFQVASYGLNDVFGFKGQYTPMRDQKTTEPYRLVGTTFSGDTIDSNFWTTATSGAGSTSGLSKSVAQMASGTATAGYGQISSVRSGRFMFAHPLQYRAAIRVPDTTIAENTRRWGVFNVSGTTPQDGYYFEIDEGGVLSLNAVNGVTTTTVTSGSFNGTVSEYKVTTSVHTYEIIYFTMGVWFYIDDVLIHKLTPTTALFSDNNTLPIAMTSVNSGAGTTSGALHCWNASVIRLGRDITAPKSVYQSGTTAGLILKRGAGDVHSVAISSVSNNSVITLYDNTTASGTVLWTSGSMGAQTQPFDIHFDIPFFTGLTLDITGANSDITVNYE